MTQAAPERVVHDRARLAHQARGREYTEAERAMAAAMARAFATGQHDFAGVAALLQEWGVARPSGAAGGWTLEVLEAELRQINDSLDDAYARHGFGA